MGWHLRDHNSKRRGILGRVRVFRDSFYLDNTIRVSIQQHSMSVTVWIPPSSLEASRRKGYCPQLPDKNPEVQRGHQLVGGKNQGSND